MLTIERTMTLAETGRLNEHLTVNAAAAESCKRHFADKSIFGDGFLEEKLMWDPREMRSSRLLRFCLGNL